MLKPMIQHLEMMRRNQPTLRIVEGETFDAWQAEARAVLVDRLGLPFELCDDRLTIDWTHESETFTETRLRFFTEEWCEAVAHLWIPKDAPKPTPVAICLQGHSTGMHISMARPIYEGDEETISGGDRDFAVQAVHRGYAAFVLEQRGFGERGGRMQSQDGGCDQVAMSALLLGRTLIGERVWDVSRSVDLIEKHFPELDAKRILVMGNSGGGTVSLYAAACDERLYAAMPSCAFSGYAESIGSIRHCSCNYVPGILRCFDMGDVAGLIAPRPLVIVNGLHDVIFPIESARREFAVTQAYYERAGVPDRCRHIVGGEGHRFYADLGWTALEECGYR